jgi:hypothetical protein
MTRTEILAQYQVGSDGVIRSPGKFEGEMLYVPFYWDIAMNGFANEDDGEVFTFLIEPEDKAIFPELNDRRSLRLYESDLGFVHAY